MNTKCVSRRQFLESSLAATSALVLGSTVVEPALAQAAKRTAVDQVTLGKTGIKLSRLGMGTGSNSSQVQWELGREGFVRLVRYAYDQGITYFDCAETYKTFDWLG